MALNAVQLVYPNQGSSSSSSQGPTSPNTYQLAPGEKLFLSQSGVMMEFENNAGYPGSGQQLYSRDGVLHLSNLRVVYIPAPLQVGLQSLSWPMENLRGKFVQPWFGPNRYEGTLYPLPASNITSPGTLKLTFNSGGAFEFSSYYTQLLQRRGQEMGLGVEEELPRYENVDTDKLVAANTGTDTTRGQGVVGVSGSDAMENRNTNTALSMSTTAVPETFASSTSPTSPNTTQQQQEQQVQITQEQSNQSLQEAPRQRSPIPALPPSYDTL